MLPAVRSARSVASGLQWIVGRHGPQMSSTGFRAILPFMQVKIHLPLFLIATGLCLTITLGAADVSGKWNFVWNTEGGIRHTEWVIAQDGETLQIRMQDGQSLTGRIEGDRMTVEGELNSPEAGYSATLKVEGELTDGRLAGKGSWDQYAMTFTATRAK